MVLQYVAIAFMAAVLMLAARMVYQRYRTSDTGSPAAQSYGHTFKPVTEIKRRLPPAPTGFLWELTVQPGRYSPEDSVLTLGLLELATSKTAATTSASLTFDHATGQSWRERYRKYGSVAAERAFEQIVYHTVDWAIREADKRAVHDGPDYHEVIS